MAKLVLKYFIKFFKLKKNSKICLGQEQCTGEAAALKLIAESLSFLQVNNLF